MRKIYLQLLIFVCACGMVQAQNLIPNGDMSAWTDGNKIPDGYTFNGNDTSPESYFSKSAQTYETLNAMDMIYGNTSTNSTRTVATPYTTTKLEAGVYELTFWLKGQGTFRSVTLANSLATDTQKKSAANSDNNIATTPLSYTSSGVTFAEWTKITQLITVSAGTMEDFVSVNFNQNNRASSGRTLAIANIALEKHVVSTDKTLKALKLSDASYTTSGAESVPGFKAEELNYKVELSYNYAGGVPQLSAEANYTLAQTSIVQATSIDGSLAERTATVLVTAENGETQTYSVVFEKTKDFICGFYYDTKSLANLGGFEHIESGSAYGKGAVSNGKYWGDYSLRQTSSGTVPFDLFTPALINGAGTVSFWLTDYADDADETSLLVQYREDAAAGWVTIATIPASDMTADWQEKSYAVNKDLSTVQVRIFVDTSTKRNFVIDDLRVTAYSSSSSIGKDNDDSALKVYSTGKNIIIEGADSGSNYQIYTVNGVCLQSAPVSANVSVAVSQPGLYIVKVGDTARKISIR